MNKLFEDGLIDDDKLVYVNCVLNGELLESEKIRHGLRDILLGPARGYEALRGRTPPP